MRYMPCRLNAKRSKRVVESPPRSLGTSFQGTSKLVLGKAAASCRTPKMSNLQRSIPCIDQADEGPSALPKLKDPKIRSH
jgi:hypothetical protein